ncbi:response regulator [Caulobacter endophyticus]|uniref:histidine kinase n=1 Tax=Caulobacter endophyticus TaxID=2172652 RepID=A0A2T9JUJ2_9CAUL|nr:response regulator [Caulobacter endophyticus]PVM87356.1 hybrid sensor histidine kinase/response regulator [Caulobacter endophyticus]
MQWLDALGADERLDEVANDTRRLTVSRLVSAALVAMVVGIALGPAMAAGWFAALAAGEALASLVIRRFTGPTTDRLRALFVLASIPINIVWSWLAVALWMFPGQDLRLAALGVCAGQIIFTQNFRHQPISLLAITTAPPLVCLMVFPFVTVAPHDMGSLTNRWAMLMLVATTINAMLLNRAAARKMDELTRGLRQEKERALAASRVKSVFVATMSHEMRTPMNGLLGLAHALKGTNLDERQRDYVELMIHSGDSLMQLLNDVLDIARLDAGDAELTPCDFDLHDLVHAVADTWRDMAMVRGLSVDVRIDATAPQRLHADPARIRQVLGGLLSNALKFTRVGGVTIEVSSQGDAPDGLETVAIRITDTGPGIDPAFAERIFESFTQADESVSRAYGGMGLGLTIARALARRMGGDLSLEPAERGARFLLLLRAPRPEAPPLPAQAPEITEDDGAVPRVLMAEDNPMNQMVVRLMLEAAGVDLTVVEDGRQALDALKASHFDCVLMDINMPVMDGVTALSEIRSGSAGAADTPVIALTASAMAGDRERFLKLGFDEHLGKPVKPLDLISAIAMAVDRTPPPRAAVG